MKKIHLLASLLIALASNSANAVICGIGMDDSTCGTPLRFPGCRVFDENGKFAYYQPDPAICALMGHAQHNSGAQGEGGTDPDGPAANSAPDASPDNGEAPGNDGEGDGSGDAE